MDDGSVLEIIREWEWTQVDRTEPPELRECKGLDAAKTQSSRTDI